MATLEIKIHCLCLFVPDEDARTVHVLMPHTGHGPHPHGPGGGDGHDGHDDHGGAHSGDGHSGDAHGQNGGGNGGGGPHRHLVNVLHRTFGDPPHKGLSMEGLTLVLGGDPGAADADTSLRPREPHPGGEEITDLTGIAGIIDPTLIGPKPDIGKVAARITLRHGHLEKLDSDARWKLDGREIQMAHEVTWRIDDFDPGQLSWEPLHADAEDPPFAKLTDLKEDGPGAYSFQVAHMTEPGLPPSNPGTLSEAEVREHFTSFYHLYGFTPQDPERHLPKLVRTPANGQGGPESQGDLPVDPGDVVAGPAADNVNCPTAQGGVKPKP